MNPEPDIGAVALAMFVVVVLACILAKFLSS